MQKIPYIADDLQPLAIKLEDLKLDPKNARRHPDRNLRDIRASLKKFGQRKPIVVQDTPDGFIVRAGNGTLQATKALKREYIAVVRIKEDDAMARAFAIADNRSGETSEWDEFILSETLTELQDVGIELEPMGFDEKEFNKITEKINGKIEDNLTSNKTIVRNNPEYLIVISAEDEQQQSALYEELLGRGLNCKIM